MVKDTWHALRKHGFTLVEIVVAMSIFTIGIMALGFSLAYSTRVIKDTAKVTENEQRLVTSVDTYIFERSVKSKDILASRDYSMTILASNIHGLLKLNGQSDSFVTGVRLCRQEYDAKKRAAFYIIELIRE